MAKKLAHPSRVSTLWPVVCAYRTRPCRRPNVQRKVRTDQLSLWMMDPGLVASRIAVWAKDGGSTRESLATDRSFHKNRLRDSLPIRSWNVGIPSASDARTSLVVAHVIAGV